MFKVIYYSTYLYKVCEDFEDIKKALNLAELMKYLFSNVKVIDECGNVIVEYIRSDI